MRSLTAIAVMLSLSLPATSAAQELDWLPDSAAPALAGRQSDSSVNWFVEAQPVYTDVKDASQPRWTGNLSVGGLAARQFGDGWHGTANGRLDLDADQDGVDFDENLSVTLREAYVGKQTESGLLFDLGRINVLDGVATGFNPTDAFRTGSVLVQRTNDPMRLRNSRLGVTGLRIQYPGDGWSVAALAAPEIDGSVDPAWYDPRLDSTNGDAQWYVRATPPSFSGLYTNLVWRRAGDETLVGVNFSRNLGQSVTAYLEGARINRRSLAASAGLDDTDRTHTQVAAGLSYTTPSRQTLTLEYEHNGAGLSASGWKNLWAKASGTQIGNLYAEASRRQEPAGQGNWLAMLQWDHFVLQDGELQCLTRVSTADYSRFDWCEWRYKFSHTDFAVSAAHPSGSDNSEYGASSYGWSLGLTIRQYF